MFFYLSEISVYYDIFGANVADNPWQLYKTSLMNPGGFPRHTKKTLY